MRTRFFSISILLMTAAAGTAWGKECVRVEAPQLTTLTLRSSVIVSSRAPGVFCTLDEGRQYRLTVSRPNHESRHLNLRYRADGSGADVGGIRTGMLLKSAILPGWGQRELGKPTRSLESFSYSVFAGFKFAQAYKDFTGERDRRDNYIAQRDAAETQSEAERLDELAYRSALATDALDRNLLRVGGFAGWVYAYNLAETWLLSSPPKVTNRSATSLTVDVPKRSGMRAAVRSAFFPGLGQKYNNSPVKAFLIQGGFVATAMFALDAKMKYDLAEAELDNANKRFATAADVNEQAQWRQEATRAFGAREGHGDDLKRYLLIGGAVWALGVVDAARSTGGRWREYPIEFSSNVSRREVNAGFRFRF